MRGAVAKHAAADSSRERGNEMQRPGVAQRPDGRLCPLSPLPSLTNTKKHRRRSRRHGAAWVTGMRRPPCAELALTATMRRSRPASRPAVPPCWLLRQRGTLPPAAHCSWQPRPRPPSRSPRSPSLRRTTALARAQTAQSPPADRTCVAQRGGDDEGGGKGGRECCVNGGEAKV